MNIDYEERDGFDIDFTGPDDYAKDDNERYINTTFGKLQDYNNKLNGPYYSPVSCFQIAKVKARYGFLYRINIKNRKF